MTSKLLAVVLLLTSFGLAQGVAGDPGVGDSGAAASGPTFHASPLVQISPVNGSASQNSCTASFGGATVANHLVVVICMTSGTSVTFSSGTDACLDTFTQVSGSPWRGTTYSIIAMQTITSGGCGTMTMNLSSSVAFNAAAMEYNLGGTPTLPGAFDAASTVVAAGTGNGTGTSLTSGNATMQGSIGSQNATASSAGSGEWLALILGYKMTSGVGDVLIGALGQAYNGSSTPFTAGTNYTLQTQGTGTSSAPTLGIEDTKATVP